MPPTAYVVHRTRQRVRLRVLEKIGDPEWFAGAADDLARLDWVDRVSTGPASASLILHCANGACLDEGLSRTGVFEFQARAPTLPPAVLQVKNELSRIDRALERSAGETNLRSLLFLLMLVLAGIQMARGRIMVPAISLLWFALDLVLGAHGSPQPDPDGEPPSQA
jgi:hypothetical protein